MITNKRKRHLISIFILVVFSLSLVQIGLADNGTTRTVVSMADFFNNSIYNICYGEYGELVTDLSGSAQIVMKISDDTVVYHINSLGGAQGVGATSGNTYQISGALQDVVVNGGESFVHNFQVVGPDPDDNFILRQRFQIHMTPEGPVITSELNEGICR